MLPEKHQMLCYKLILSIVRGGGAERVYHPQRLFACVSCLGLNFSPVIGSRKLPFQVWELQKY